MHAARVWMLELLKISFPWSIEKIHVLVAIIVGEYKLHVFLLIPIIGNVHSQCEESFSFNGFAVSSIK